jgi:hypothetical protein
VTDEERGFDLLAHLYPREIEWIKAKCRYAVISKYGVEHPWYLNESSTGPKGGRVTVTVDVPPSVREPHTHKGRAAFTPYGYQNFVYMEDGAWMTRFQPVRVSEVMTVEFEFAEENP